MGKSSLTKSKPKTDDERPVLSAFEIPEAGTEPELLPPRASRPAVNPRMTAGDSGEPAITLVQFLPRLRPEHRGGFSAFCTRQDLDGTRKTVAQWQQVLAAHWTRKIT